MKGYLHFFGAKHGLRKEEIWLVWWKHFIHWVLVNPLLCFSLPSPCLQYPLPCDHLPDTSCSRFHWRHILGCRWFMCHWKHGQQLCSCLRYSVGKNSICSPFWKTADAYYSRTEQKHPCSSLQLGFWDWLCICLEQWAGRLLLQGFSNIVILIFTRSRKLVVPELCFVFCYVANWFQMGWVRCTPRPKALFFALSRLNWYFSCMFIYIYIYTFTFTAGLNLSKWFHVKVRAWSQNCMVKTSLNPTNMSCLFKLL